MAERCTTCDKSLSGHPKIRLDGSIYCYSCAKSVVGAKDHVAELDLAPKLEEYESQVALYETWQQNLKAAMPSGWKKSIFAFSTSSILMREGLGRLRPSPGSFLVASMPSLLPLVISQLA